MADNAAQAIKDLQERLVSADKTLGEVIQRLDKYDDMISHIFQEASRNAKLSFDDITDYLTKKMRRENLKQSESLVKDILGIDEGKKEIEKIPTMFDRVITQINQRAQQSGENFAKKLVNAESAKNEAEEFARTFIRTFQRTQQQIQQTKGNVATAFADVPQSLQPWINTVFKFMDTARGHQALVNNPITKYAEALKQLQELERRYEGTDNALGRSYKNALIKVREYIEEVQKVKQLEEQAAQSQQKYASNVSAIEGVTRRYNDNEQAIKKVIERWEELNVKKQAGLVNEKDFKTQTQQILDEYDRLMAKRKEFEIGDLGQMSSERVRQREEEEERLNQLRKSNHQARVDDEMRAEKMIKQAKAERAKKEAEADANMKKAVGQQITNYKQLSALLKQYNSLKNIKGRTNEENAALEQTRQKIKEIIAEMHKLDKEQSGSLGKARDITEYDRILAKDKEITRERERQNRQTQLQKRNLESLLPTLQRLASAFGIVFSVRGLVQFGKKLIETRGEFELQQVALRSILQNKQLADEIWDKTMQAALQSPFTAMQLTRYTKQLAAYRIETDKLFETTKRLADVSAGLGVDMQRLILAYGQVKAANYLRASEIRQFTEAGVNILGELRDYFNEVKGMSVNTAQVMDMVQKRLVGFRDVEAIFQRMTDQGGIFYNMQYVQSQTVKGQINKLHDAYDQMLNSIGKENQGTIKNFVAALNSIVKNWRDWAVAIKAIGWGAAIGYMSKFAFALTGVQKASVTTLKSIANLKQGWQNLISGFSTNWPQLAAAGVAMLVATFINLDKKMKAVNKEIDEQNLRLYESRRKFEDLKSKIEENNKAIEKEGRGTEASNKAKKENDNILKKLKDEYPQLADRMKIATNGIIDMNDALDINIRKLNEQMTILTAMKQENWFTKSDQQTLQEGEQALAAMQVRMASVQGSALSEMQKLEDAFGGKEEAEKSALYQIYKSVSEIDLEGNILAAVDAFKQLNEQANEYLGNKRVRPNQLYYTLGVSNVFGGLSSDLKQTEELGRMVQVINKHQAALKKAYERAIRDNAEFAMEINKQYGGDVSAFIVKNAERINKATLEGLNQANEIFIKTLGPQTDVTKKFWNLLLNNIYGYEGVDLFSTAKMKTGGDNETPEEKQAKVDAAWRRRISLLEEMKKRYDELAKSAYGYAKSEKTVREAFDDFINEKGIKEEGSFYKIFKGTGITMDMIDFTSMEGMMKSTRLVLQQAKGISDAVREEIMKKIDSYNAQITIDAEVRIREDFGRQIENALGDYELTLELDKLNLPKGLASEMFGVGKTELSDLRSQMTEMFNGLKDENGQLSEEAFKDYRKYIEKIDDLERKQQKERLKDYSKYLEAQYSERVKIEMEYVRKLSELEAETAIKDTQKDSIRKGLEREFLEKSRKQDWEDFKGSEFYVQMMEDLEKQGSKSLDLMKEKLLEMRKNAENLSPRALKEVVNALEKIEDIEQKRIPPLQRLHEARQKLDKQDIENIYKKIAADQSELALEEKKQKDLERMIMLEEERQKLEKQGVTFEQAKTSLLSWNNAVKAAQKDVDNFKSSGTKEDQDQLASMLEILNNAKMNAEMWQLAVNALSGEQVISSLKEESKYRNMSLEDMRKEYEEAKNRAKTIGATIEDEEELVKWAQRLQEAWNDTWEATKNWAQQIQGIFDGVMDTLDYFEDSTSTFTAEWKEFGDTTVSAFTDLVGGIQQFQFAWKEMQKGLKEGEEMSLAKSLMSGDLIRLAMVVLGVIIKIVNAVLKLHDSKIDKQIEQMKDKVDDLKDAYDRLEKSIEKTFDTVSYMRDYNAEVQNLYEQIEKANDQIAAAQGYKDADKRKEAIEAAEDAKQEALDALDEIKQKQIEVFGGIGEDNYRSAAEGFVDAWKSAFLETGDGLQGLQDHFDEFLQDWFVKQATMRIAGSTLDPLFEKIDQAVDQYGLGGTDVTWQELSEINELKDLLLNRTKEQLKSLASVFGLEGEGGLSGLAAGIQGMTEEQANILEAYWNNVRSDTESIDKKVAMLLSDDVNTNPMLQQIALVAQNTNSINTLLQSVTKSGHTMGGMGLKVFVN